METLLDTNVIFAYLYEKDYYHKKAIEIVNKLDRIYLPTVVILELAYIFRKQNFSMKVLYNILTSEEVEYINTEIEDILFSLNNLPKSYDEFNDYIILHTALRLNLELITFDKKLKELYLKFRGKYK